MDNNIDTKKVIQMVAIIGILCLFVGIATRIRQNSQVTLADYESPSQTSANSTNSDAADSGTTGSTVEASNPANSTENAGTGIGSGNNDLNSSDSEDSALLSEMNHEEYDAFYYIDRPDGTALVYLLYYNTAHEITTGQLECNQDVAYDLLLIFYKLYKNQYEFTSITPLSEYENEEAARLANNTYCAGSNLIINPYYNPIIKYENDTAVCEPSASAAYADRASDFPYKITTDDYAYTLLTESGFYWGGNRNGSKDYASFKK